jgi:hypothetical protein
MVGALEKACAASPGWKPMARGGALNEPTAMVGAGRVSKLPPARHRRGDDTTVSAERPSKSKSEFWSFLAAVLVAAALLALIGWQADPALPQKVGGMAQRLQVALGLAQAPPEPVAPANQAAAPGGTGQATAAPVAAAPAEGKPSPIPPAAPSETSKTDAAQPEAETAAAASVQQPPEPALQSPASAPKIAPEKPRPPVRPLARPQPIAIASSPAGAKATLDGNRDDACNTPCSLHAAHGHHTLSVVLPGYQVEHLDVDVGSGPMELPPVVLRAIAGALMVTSTPPGATVDVNGHRMTQTTPATIPLSAGAYRVTVGKDGKQATSNVDIRNGAISYLKVTLQ